MLFNVELYTEWIQKKTLSKILQSFHIKSVHKTTPDSSSRIAQSQRPIFLHQRCGAIHQIPHRAALNVILVKQNAVMKPGEESIFVNLNLTFFFV